MFNTDSTALGLGAQWRSTLPIAQNNPLYEPQRRKRKRATAASTATEHAMAQVSGPALDDPVYLTQLRRDLVRFARLQLRDAAAWTQADRFAAQSEHKTWVFGILRHKLIDTLRARQRTINLSALESELDGEALLDRELFKDNGHWLRETKPRPWPTPETALRQQQFWTLFEMCLEHLPEQIGRVFMMREFLDLETEAICTELNMTANHCSVLIYRARLRLRTCLSEKGLSSEDANGEV
jgi:RNA polymerase sigma-70 factor (ECF subfamily)